MVKPFNIVIVGPPRSGKSTLANLLSESEALNASREYRPTCVCRIIDLSDPEIGMIRLYDTSGDECYMKLIPCICETPDARIVLWPHDEIEACSTTRLEPFSNLASVPADRSALVIFNSSEESIYSPHVQIPESVASVCFGLSITDKDTFRSTIINWIRKLFVYIWRFLFMVRKIFPRITSFFSIFS